MNVVTKMAKWDQDTLVKAIGHRIRLARTLAGMHQSEVGKLVGCSYQQLQKYESGYNRITAERLFKIAVATNQPPSFFFEDLRTDEHRISEEQEGLRGPMVMEFITLLAQLNTADRKTVLSVMRGIAKK